MYDHLIEELDKCTFIDRLLGQLGGELEPRSKNIADALLGVGLLASKHCLKNKLSCEYIELLLQQIKSSEDKHHPCTNWGRILSI